jgi:leucyl aminopeptidase
VELRFSTASPADLGCDALVAFVAEGDTAELSTLDQAFGGQLQPWLTARAFTGGEGQLVAVPAFGRLAATQLVVVGIGDAAPAKVRSAAGRAARELRASKARHVGAWLGSHTDPERRSAAQEGFGIGTYAYERRPEKELTPALSAVTFAVTPGRPDVAEARAEVARRWQDWVRELVNAPAAEIYPESLAARAGELSRHGVTVEVWDPARLQAEGCVGILAVGQGSTRTPRLIHASWNPPGATRRVALIGKGVTFDSGGLSLKPSAGMQTMRCDMAGAATVLGAIGAAAELQLPVAIDVWVGAVENMTGSAAYKLGDILTYSNGVTVEIHTTDAEGRLVLADCLIQASKQPVSEMLDLATLTGACVVAVGQDFTGLFTADDALAGALLHAAAQAGEGLWRLPLHKPYKDQLKADWAQLKNVGSRDAGATTAALFLEHFVGKDKRWAHLDIAGPALLEKPSGMYAAGATGQPLRTLLRWLQ